MFSITPHQTTPNTPQFPKNKTIKAAILLILETLDPNTIQKILNQAAANYPQLIGCTTTNTDSEITLLLISADDRINLHAGCIENPTPDNIINGFNQSHQTINAKEKLCLIFPPTQALATATLAGIQHSELYKHCKILGGILQNDTQQGRQFWGNRILTNAIPYLICAGKIKLETAYSTGLEAQPQIQKWQTAYLYQQQLDTTEPLPDNSLILIRHGKEQHNDLLTQTDSGQALRYHTVDSSTKLAIKPAHCTQSSLINNTLAGLKKHNQPAFKPAALLCFSSHHRTQQALFNPQHEDQLIQEYLQQYHPDLPWLNLRCFGEIGYQLANSIAPRLHQFSFISLLIGEDRRENSSKERNDNLNTFSTIALSLIIKMLKENQADFCRLRGKNFSQAQLSEFLYDKLCEKFEARGLTPPNQQTIYNYLLEAAHLETNEAFIQDFAQKITRHRKRGRKGEDDESG